jgi:ABC-2 type transport system permease protein
MHALKMYGRFLKVYMKQQLEYRFAFFGDIGVNMMTFITLYASFWVLFRQFPVLNGWSFYECMLLYNLNLISYAISSLFLWGPMKFLDEMIRKGEFDSFLIRPIGPLKLLVLRQFQHTFIGHIIIAAIVFAVCFDRLGIHWTIGQMLFFASVVLGATLIHAAIIIAAASSAFWVVKSSAVVDVSIYGIRNYINYPISIYGKGLRIFLTFIMPYAFVNFYPAEVLLDKTSDASIGWFQYGTPAVGIILFFAAVKLFNFGVSRYESSGS